MFGAGHNSYAPGSSSSANADSFKLMPNTRAVRRSSTKTGSVAPRNDSGRAKTTCARVGFAAGNALLGAFRIAGGNTTHADRRKMKAATRMAQTVLPAW